MKYLVFNPTVNSGFPCPSFLERLPGPKEIIHVDAEVLASLSTLNAADYTVIAASPYWIQTVLAFQPAAIFYWMEKCPDGEDTTLWNQYAGLFAAHSRLVFTDSEQMYLEQCLLRDAVFWVDSFPAAGPEEMKLRLENEQLLERMLAAQEQGETLEPWTIRQWESRERYYTDLSSKLGPHETAGYLAASYRYFLKRPEALVALTVSFEQMLLKDHHACLHSHVRFFSALELQHGRLDKAVRLFDITAFTEEERRTAAKLYAWLHSGRTDWVRAELYRVNEDIRSAIHVLEPSSDPEARAGLLPLYSRAHRWREALALLDAGTAPPDGMSAEVLRGTLHLIHNRRREAIQVLLRASIPDWSVLTHLNGMIALEQAAQAIAAGEERMA